MRENPLLQRVVDSIERLSPRVLLPLVACMAALIGLLDFVSGSETSCAIFYVIPVGIVSWRFGRQAIVVMAVLSGLIWLGAEYATAPPYSSPIILLWNAFMRLAFFYLIGTLLRLVRTREVAAIREREGATVAQHITRLLVEHIGHENNRINDWLYRSRTKNTQVPQDVESASARIGAYLSVLSEAAFAYPYYSSTGKSSQYFLTRLEERMRAARTEAPPATAPQESALS